MTGYSGSISGANDAWLKDLIRSREAARESLYSQASTVPLDTPLKQPVSISRTMRDFCVNTLNYIGEHPVEFALSVGTAMAVRWGVTAGLIALSSGAIGGLALSIAAAMITSVVLGVGKAALKGESVSAGKTGKQALLSGVIAGVLGAFLGGMIPVETQDATVISHDALRGMPEGTNFMDALEGRPEEPIFTDDGINKPKDRYAWKLDATDEKKLEKYIELHEDDYVWIPYKDYQGFWDYFGNPVGESISELLNSGKEWFFFETEEGDLHAIHRDALQEIQELDRQLAAAEGLPAPRDTYLRGGSSFAAGSNTLVKAGEDCKYDLAFLTGSLIHEKDIHEAILYHELGHVDHNCNHDHGKDLSLHEEEYEADDSMLKRDNYGGYMESFSRMAAEDGAEWDSPSDSHPSTKDRLLRGIELAAKDTTLDAKEKILFKARLRECTRIIKDLPGAPDLVKLWKEALGKATGMTR